MARRKKADALGKDELTASELVSILATSNKAKFGSAVKVATRIPTGLYGVDKILGGGIPKGRITEIFGRESSAKTLIAMLAIAEAQRAGGRCVFMDLERSFDPVWAQKNGIDLDELIIVTPDDGDEAWDILTRFLETREIALIVLDSIAQVVPRAELEGSIGQANIGLAARLNAQAMRKITSMMGGDHDTALVFINQTRSNVSTMGMGPTDTTAGGKAIPFYASLRLELRRIGYARKGEEVTGGEFRMRVHKAKLTGIKPYAATIFEVDFDTGVDKAKDLIPHAIKHGWLKKAGAWYVLDENNKFQGETAFKEHLMSSGLYEEWRSKLNELDTGK